MRVNQADENDDSFVQNEQADGLTNQELHQLVHDHQRFLQTVQKFNEEAEIKINANVSKQALPYLIQGQKILQYAASCGKNIDRSLIISILHNEACSYQKAWELTKCSNYLEALIFNMTEYLQLEEPKMLKKNNSVVPTCTQFFLDKSMRLVKYYLQFAAVNSQIKNHEGAFQSSKKSINLLRTMLKSLNNSFKYEKQLESFSPFQSKEQVELKSKIVGSISSMGQSFQIKNLQDYIASSQYFFYMWHKNKSLNECEMIQDILKKFSIGNVMQIVCDSLEQKRQPEEENIYFNTSDSIFSQSRKYQVLKTESYLKILEKILMLSIAYFTAATELRLTAHQKFKLCLQTLKNSPQFKESQIYHLVSLMIIFAYVPFQMQFVSHIISSYQKNYKGQLQIFKQEKVDLYENGREEILRQIDPFSIHLIYTNKKQEQESLKHKKTVEMASRKSSKTQSITPRAGSNPKIHKQAPSVTKLQKRCKHIINNNYAENDKDEVVIKDDASKSLTYINKQKHRTRSNRSKKSLSITNTILKKDNGNSHVKIQNYYSPMKNKGKKKEKDENSKETMNKIKGYYDSMMPQSSSHKSLKKLNELKSPKSKINTKKKSKSKLNLKASIDHRDYEKTEKLKRSTSKSKSKNIKGVKIDMKSGKNYPFQNTQRSTNKTPHRIKRQILPSAQYYN